MENSFGEFLKQKRQEKKLTQKELAKILIVSESAISKWEKDVAHPDITLLPKISEVLGVSEHELITASIDNQSREEKSQAKKWRTLSFSWSLFFYISYGIALLTCFICNLAINKTLSWFYIVLSAIILAFTFTNLPKIIKKYKLILIPISILFAVYLLLGVCCIYTNGKWFWISSISVLLGFVIIFIPIYISKFSFFKKVKKFNDFISIGIDFLLLNILLGIINIYTFLNSYTTSYWYFKIALPIITITYLFLNLLLCIRFLKINNFLKTSIILALISLFLYIPPTFLRFKSANLQNEIDDINILKTNFSNWKINKNLENNIHCIIFLTLIFLAIIFTIVGLLRYFKEKNKSKIK